MLHVRNKRLHDVLHADGVLRGNYNLIVGRRDVHVVGGDRVKPGLPLLGLLVPVPVINAPVLREVDLLDLHLVTQPLVKALAAKLRRSGSERPCETQDEDLLDCASECIDMIWGNFLGFSLNIVKHIAVKQA